MIFFKFSFYPVKMLGSQQSDEISRYIILTLILALYTASAPASGARCSRGNAILDKTKCQVERKEFIITFATCEPISVCLNVCRGLCPTQTIVNQDIPFIKQHCTCCKPSKYKRYRIQRTTMCTNNSGEKIRQEKTLYLMKILECGCRHCY